MPQQLVPWSGGLNRATGTPSQSPQGFSELVNALLLDATLRLRPAIGAPAVTIPGVDTICFVGVFEAVGEVIYITYTTSTRSVDVYTADLQGNTPTLLGHWGTLDTEANSPPLFSIAESFSILVLAHDEEVNPRRLTTQIYDPNGMTLLSPLLQDLVNQPASDPQPVKFRWVANHFTYILGGCFGNHATESRPELVRFSHADDPRLYDATDYVICGARDVPCVGGRSVPTGVVSGTAVPTGAGASVFIVGKPGQLWTIQGQDRTTWAPQLLDAETGCANHRAMAFMEGLLYVWSTTGPYVTDGITVTAAGLDLDLPNAYPADLPSLGPPHHLWALALPDERHLVFWLPDPTQARMLGYVLSARTPTTRRWGLWVAPTSIHGACVTQGYTFSESPPGEADPVTTSGSAGSGAAEITTVLTPINVVGDESVEVWYKTTGSWMLLKTTPLDTSSPTQTMVLTGVMTGAYSVAVRLKRQGRFASGYSGDPSTWPSYSRASGTVTVIPNPSGVSLSYDYSTGTATASWTPGDPSLDVDIALYQVVLDQWSSPIPLAPDTLTYPFDASALAQPRDNGDSVVVRVRHRVGTILGDWISSNTVPIAWFGTDAPPPWSVVDDQESVANGTSIDVQFAVPVGVVGNWEFHLLCGANLGAYPANAGCGTSFPVGNAYFFPAATAVTQELFGLTFPDTESNPVTVTGVPPLPCAQCSVVGQVIGMGLAAGYYRFAKSGTLMHRTSAFLSGYQQYLPGSNAGYAFGVVCQP